MNKILDSFNHFNLSVVSASIYFIWALMPVFTAEYAPKTVRMFFFGILLLSILLSVIENGIIVDNKKLVLLIIVVITFFGVMSGLSYKDAKKYLLVVIIFWVPLILNNLMNLSQRIALTKIIMIILAVTTFTSTIGVVADNSVARTIAHAISDDSVQIAISRRNIAGLYLFQMLVVLFPTLLGFMEVYGKKKMQIISIFTLLFVLVNASFSIALFLAILMIALIYYHRIVKYNGSGYAIVIFGIIICAYLAFMLFGGYLFDFLIRIVGNERIIERLVEIKLLLFGGQSVATSPGDVTERMELYKKSWETFLSHFMTGVGPYYSFIKMHNGIGFHSQILDDLARFGLPALFFYFVFIKEYYRLLRTKWEQFNMEWVAVVTVFIYVIFIFLNLGFRSDFESSVMLVVIPNAPLIIEQRMRQDEVDEISKEYIL